MERAKQVTMGELNASIGVRGLPPLPHSVCTLYSHIFFSFCSFLFSNNIYWASLKYILQIFFWLKHLEDGFR